MENRHGIGGNNPPSDAELLTEKLALDYASLTIRRDELLAAMERMPETITDDETAGKVADYIKQLRGTIEQSGTCRTDEKDAFLMQGRAVDGWFGDVSKPLMEAKKQAEERLGKFATDGKKAYSDNGTTYSSSTTWGFHVDHANLDVETLKYVSPDAINKAIRAFIKEGGRELNGVEIFETTKVNVR